MGAWKPVNSSCNIMQSHDHHLQPSQLVSDKVNWKASGHVMSHLKDHG